MDDLPEYKPPRKRSKAAGWVLAMLGLFLLNLAAVFLGHAATRADGWIALPAGVCAWCLLCGRRPGDSVEGFAFD